MWLFNKAKLKGLVCLQQILKIQFLINNLVQI